MSRASKRSPSAVSRRPLPDAALFRDLFPAASDNTRVRKRAKSHGQSLVEFALLTPVLVLILALAADFGRAFTAYIAISSAAREGASYGSDSATQASNAAGIRTAALADAASIWGTAPSVSSSTGTDAYGYSYVQVTVNYTFSPLLVIPPIPSTVSMNRVVRMRVIN